MSEYLACPTKQFFWLTPENSWWHSSLHRKKIESAQLVEAGHNRSPCDVLHVCVSVWVDGLELGEGEWVETQK